MAGIYYYIWFEESLNDHALVTRELEDIKKNLKMDWLLMDLQYSLLRSWEGRYVETTKHVVNVCEDLGLKIMPIPHIGSGMLTPVWIEEHHNEMAMDSDGNVAIMEDTGPCMSYYSRLCLEELTRHTESVLELVEPVHYQFGGHKIIEIMEDVGYPRYVKTDFTSKATYSKTTAVANFVGKLCDHARSLGNYKCIHKAFRDAQPHHPELDNMGLDYRKLIAVTDGEIETIAPWSMANANRTPDYELVREGLDFFFSLTKDKLAFTTILCEREEFDPRPQVELVRDREYSDLAWFSYNEGLTVDSELKHDKVKREQVVRLGEQFAL